MSTYNVFERTTRHAIDFLESLPTRPVAAQATAAELRQALDKPLTDSGVPPEVVIDELVHDVDRGLLASAGGRFFGWVIGGGLPAAVAADWLTSAWDQNATIYACGPAAAVVEEITGQWLKELLGLPADASFAFVTGCQMAHVTALAAARHRLLASQGWNVEERGLPGAPPIRVLTSSQRHESLIRAVRLLGMGSECIQYVPSDEHSRIRVDALAEILGRSPDAPTVVWLQAGDLNTGTFDPFNQACDIAHTHGAWVHIDGAFGLWVAASDQYRHLLEGVEKADSWATDGHKWLNVPFDSGMVFVAHPDAHRASLSTTASYLVTADDAARDQINWTPEWSRRSRGFAVYAALRSLGRQGVAQLIERCCAHAHRLVTEIGTLPGAEVLAEPQVNQGLVRFLSVDGDHDRRTDEVIENIRSKGVAWFGGTTWNGMRAMRVSVCNWRTKDDDVTQTIDSVRKIITQ